MSNVSKSDLINFQDPVRIALANYSERSDGKVSFDLDTATQLELTPDKPNSARSRSVVEHLGKPVGDLYVIVFDYEDGTGDESTYRLKDSMMGGFYPLERKVVPRSKAAVHSEAHLTIASNHPHKPNADPVMYAGNLEVVGFHNERFTRLAHLGQTPGQFKDAELGLATAEPTATFTTGYRVSNGERFGDPHSVFNPRMNVQICGFIAVSNEMADEHASMLVDLGAVEPDPRS